MTSKFSSDPEVSSMLKDLSQRIASKPTQNGAANGAANGKTTLNGKASLKTATPVADNGAAVDALSVDKPEAKPYQRKIVWFNAIGFLILHLGTLYGIYLGMFEAYLITDIWAFVVGFISAQSVLLGAHRLYTHRSYKATFPLRLLIVLWQTVSSQNCLWVWVRDHRQHHKYSDTNADPHNARRGFFFSHVGWLMVKKHPDVFEAGRKVDMSDIEADWLVMFQKKYYNILYVLLSVLFPTVVPVYLWGETWWNSFFISFLTRTFVVLNVAWLVNSWAHLYGTHPFNQEIMPSESRLVSFLTFGEGWHNFHHTFPWDYRAAEFGQNFNFTCNIIEFFEKIGWAYDLKAAPEELVRKRALRTGDGTHPRYNKEGVPEHLVAEPEPGAEDADLDDEDGEAVLAKVAANKTDSKVAVAVAAERSKEKRG
ncbi:stearoyl-CoA desaturase 5-like isoform X2 [Thrips palmi]|nr:stearoyl-CoA desaturase 5-like isoform X2 [Thrips palmi]XP_034256287.1 stearoyl-CoA desaturase 5-like isoform X2 [Thrips palmi]XP_034256289.1 stearoyl-CoA desaturase 5-like isoform X2 [Thrips palmi]